MQLSSERSNLTFVYWGGDTWAETGLKLAMAAERAAAMPATGETRNSGAEEQGDGNSNN